MTSDTYGTGMADGGSALTARGDAQREGREFWKPPCATTPFPRGGHSQTPAGGPTAPLSSDTMCLDTRPTGQGLRPTGPSAPEKPTSSPGAVCAPDPAALAPTTSAGAVCGYGSQDSGKRRTHDQPRGRHTWDRYEDGGSSPLQRRLSPQIPTCSRTRSSPHPIRVRLHGGCITGLTDEARVLADGTQPPAPPVPKVRDWD